MSKIYRRVLAGGDLDHVVGLVVTTAEAGGLLAHVVGVLPVETHVLIISSIEGPC